MAEFGGDDGHAALYFANSKKLETISGGIEVTGTVTDDGATHDGDVTFTGANGNIVFDKSDDALEFADNVKAVFGTGGDLKIYHNGSFSFIEDSGTGAIVVNTNALQLKSADNNEFMMYASQNGSVDLYYDNVKKFETTSTGATVTGTLSATLSTASQPNITSVGTLAGLTVNNTLNVNPKINVESTGGYGAIEIGGASGGFIDLKTPFSDDHDFRIITDGTNSDIRANLITLESISGEEYIVCTKDGSVDLYHNDVKKFETTSTGATVSGKLDAGVLEGEGGVTYDPPGSSGSDTSTAVGLALHSGARIVLGTGGYIRTIVDATANSALKFGQSGTGYFAGTEIYGGNSGVKLHHSSTNILETKSTGVDVNGDLTLTSTDAGASAAPTLSLYRNSASPASSDDVGQIQFFAENDADEKVEYARIDVRNSGVTDGGEYGQMDFMYKNSGSDIVAFRLSFGLAQFYNDLYIGSPYKIRFEGSAYNNFETDLAVAGPTADRTITLPDATGTVITTGNMNSITDIGVQQYDIHITSSYHCSTWNRCRFNL